jgi:hypothetical protein
LKIYFAKFQIAFLIFWTTISMREIRELVPPVPPAHSIAQSDIQNGSVESQSNVTEPLRYSNDANTPNDTEEAKHHEEVTRKL